MSNPTVARCLICGQTALKAMPYNEAVTAYPYVCFHCVENDPDEAERTARFAEAEIQISSLLRSAVRGHLRIVRARRKDTGETVTLIADVAFNGGFDDTYPIAQILPRTERYGMNDAHTDDCETFEAEGSVIEDIPDVYQKTLNEIAADDQERIAIRPPVQYTQAELDQIPF